MCSVSVSRRKVLRLLVAVWRWKCGAFHLSRLRRYVHACLRMAGWRIMWLRPCKAL